jgi:hypothetical protein
MTLDLTRNARTAIVPCLPCCNTGYQNCACGVNEKLNTLGGKNASGQDLDKSHPANFVTLFIKDLFVGESSVANKGERTDSIFQDGMNAYSVTCSDKVWTFSFPVTPRTLQAQTRFYADRFEGRLVIDGVDSGWVELSKTYGSEYLTTLQGTISGFEIISHSVCQCRGDITSPGNIYPPHMKETDIGTRPYYATFEGLPAACTNISGNTFLFNRASTPVPAPLQNEADLAAFHANYPVAGYGSVQNGPNWRADFKMVFSTSSIYVYCLGKIISVPFGWQTDAYFNVGSGSDQAVVGNKSALTFTATTTTLTGQPAGTTHWLNYYPWNSFYGIPQTGSGLIGPEVYLLEYPDFSYPIKIDFEPFYYEYTAYGHNGAVNDYGLSLNVNHSIYPGEIFSPKVIITE